MLLTVIEEKYACAPVTYCAVSVEMLVLRPRSVEKLENEEI
jgi:hypothetical protein